MAAKIKHDDEMVEMHEINVTPFIDVMLVLLIIFMVVAPLATVNIKVDLPASKEKPQPDIDSPLHLIIQEDHSFILGNNTVALEDLSSTLKVASNGNIKQRIFLSADKSVDYDTLIQAIKGLRSAGYQKVSLVAIESRNL